MELTRDQKIIRNVLIEVAQSHNYQACYSDVIIKARLSRKYDMSYPPDRTAFGDELGTISQYEVENGRPMLSSVVYNLKEEIPGNGFFDLAQSLYKIDLTDKSARETFFYDELDKTSQYWKKLK